MKLFNLIVLSLALWLAAGTGLCGQDKNDVTADTILSGLEQRYAQKGFSADFHQAARLTALDITEEARGKAWFSYPGKMRWTYETPDRHEIITNGKSLWIYRPDEKQVMTGRAEAFFKSGAGGVFLSDIARIRQDFSITMEKAGNTIAALLLIPKKESQEIASIRLTVGLADHDIREAVTENPYGDTTKFVFTNIRFADPDPGHFDFTVPQDVEIIEMN